MGKFILALGAILAAMALHQRVGAAEQIGHSVDYQVELRNLPPGATGSGIWQLGLTPVCKAWKITQSINVSIKAGDKLASIVVVQRGEEAADGSTAKYSTQYAANGQQIIVNATLTGGKMNTTVGTAVSTKDIPAGTLLLASASQAMIDQLLAGKTDFSLRAIEPTAPDGIAELRIQVMSDSPFSRAPLPADTTGALKGKSWFIRLTKKQGNGSVDTLMQFHESGVVSRIIAEISGIKFEMTARDITVFPKPNC